MAPRTIKIPDSIYVGLRSRHQNNAVPMGIMTAYGTDTSSKNRMTNVDRSIGKWHTEWNLGTTVLENHALVGFKIVGEEVSGDVWHIQDPRGFVVEVMSDNVASLLMDSNCINGELITPCVWAREGGNNVLVSTESAEYKTAVINTTVSKGKASWKDVNLGDTILLRNNKQGRWLGKMYLVQSVHGTWSSQLANNEFTISDNAYHLIYVTESNRNGSSNYIHIIANPQLSKIVSSDLLTKQEAELLANQYLQDPACTQVTNRYCQADAASFDKIQSYNLQLIQVPINVDNELELSELLADRYMLKKPAVFAETSTAFGKLRNLRNSKNTSECPMVEYSKQHIQFNELRKVLSPVNNRYGNTSYSEKITPFFFNTSEKLFNFKLELKTQAGNVISYYIR